MLTRTVSRGRHTPKFHSTCKSESVYCVLGKPYKKIIINDVKKIQESTHEKVVERLKFGFLPLMAGCCDGQIGVVNAESFAERIISCANLAMAASYTLLNDKALEIPIVCA
jgi:hypothetical protein